MKEEREAERDAEWRSIGAMLKLMPRGVQAPGAGGAARQQAGRSRGGHAPATAAIRQAHRDLRAAVCLAWLRSDPADTTAAAFATHLWECYRHPCSDATATTTLRRVKAERQARARRRAGPRERSHVETEG